MQNNPQKGSVGWIVLTILFIVGFLYMLFILFLNDHGWPKINNRSSYPAYTEPCISAPPPGLDCEKFAEDIQHELRQKYINYAITFLKIIAGIFLLFMLLKISRKYEGRSIR